MEQYAVFAPVLYSERLTMTLYDVEKDTPFMVEFANVLANVLPESSARRIWTDESMRRLMKNTTLSPRNCLGLIATRPSVYVVHLGSKDGPCIGQISLSERNLEIAPDIGYGILPAYRRQGFAFEASRCVLSYWLNSFGLKSMTGFCMPANVPSNKLMIKLGFERGGEATVEEGDLVTIAYVLPGMSKTEMTREGTRFSRMGTYKAD